MNIPNAGGGLHWWILQYTRYAILRGQHRDEVLQSTWSLTYNKGRPHDVLRVEIENAIDGAILWAKDHLNATVSNGRCYFQSQSWEDREDESGDGYVEPLPWNRWVRPKNEKLIRSVLKRPLERLRPLKVFDLSQLYGNFNFPLCLAPEVDQPHCRLLSYWQKHLTYLEQIQWMVPNPCLKCGDGGAMKTYQNACERIWAIVEFDQGTWEEQLKLLCWLERSQADWNLAMIVYSGGKSMHGWFSCVGMSERYEIMWFYRLATSLGADKMMRSSVQYTRFPLGINRKTKRFQEIRHWNEDAIAEHTQNLKKRLQELS